MPEDKTCQAEKIIIDLIEKGWKIQKDGHSHMNGTLGTNLYKGSEVITIQQEFMPDEEFIEEQWPDVE